MSADQRLPSVARLLEHFRPESSLAFCNTKARCRALAELLQAQGYSALELHGDLEQRDRGQVLVRFVNGSCSVLVATDVAARGLDVTNLAAVINVDVTPDPEVRAPHRSHGPREPERSGAELGDVGRNGFGRANRATARRCVGLVPIVRTHAHCGRTFDAIKGHRAHSGQPQGQDSPRRRAGRADGGLGYTREQIGKIDINDFATYVAVDRSIARDVVAGLNNGRIKGRTVKARLLKD